ncbi:MAG: glycosyltransferase, partial [Armatimonadetes bacterium]|nr:glycosyltransferase [Armatimonadota bacterium]NIM23983.1 glycosyltransferase [Armatimonadota bacterium]NIM67833.1 glycosyltransferase [Armatimonadota bacterium]NIM76364.1 glycosyltransferase [Armatimonadota bacterium]NIN06063.1 glycosyltransferase [Armatimonadota bacterium]
RNRGVHLAVEAFRSFASQYPEVHLVIMGKESQPAYAASIRNRVKELGLEQRVIFWGHVRHEEMADFYAAGEMCLIPSLCGEGTSLAALEAMACGVAVVSTDVAGLKDLPTAQCPPQAEALARTMLQVYPERRRIGDEQRQQVNDEYSHERWSQAWLEVIHQVERT